MRGGFLTPKEGAAADLRRARQAAGRDKIAERAKAKADAKQRRLARGAYGNARQMSLFGRLLGGTASGKSG
jgi:hypothetical protein